MADVHTKEIRSKNMRAIKSSNTKIEMLLGKALWEKGIRYRKNNKNIFGKPDFSIKKYRLAIFCDGEFFHGKDWGNNKHRIKSNVEFWHNKIEGNIKRDKLVTKTLKDQGWHVIRFWETDIKNNLVDCVHIVENVIWERKEQNIQP